MPINKEKISIDVSKIFLFWTQREISLPYAFSLKVNLEPLKIVSIHESSHLF